MSLESNGGATSTIREVQGGVELPPSQDKIEAKFDLSIALTLFTWPALTLAVQNSWGGSDSSEKRDWFAGVISDLIAATPDADVEYVEEFLLQVMNDTFDVNVEDGSGEEIAAKIVGLRKLTSRGDFKKVDDMYQEWIDRQYKGESTKLNIQHVAREEEDDDTDWDSDDDEEEDVDMDAAPALIQAPKEKIQPRTDEEGFTEVINRRRR